MIYLGMDLFLYYAWDLLGYLKSVYQYFQFWATLNYYTFCPIFFSFFLLVSASLVTSILDFLVVSCYPTYSALYAFFSP